MTRTATLVASFLICVALQNSAANAQAPGSPAPQPATETLDVRVQKLLAKVKSSLRFIKGGTFDMGDWGNEAGVPYDFEKNSRPLHKVTLNSFSMMAYKVTYDDFDVFTDATSKERVDTDEINIRYRSPKRPAGVSWHGAEAYCQWLASVAGLPFSLPTEAQWEYAARSGGKRMLFATDNGKIDRGRNFPAAWKYGEKPSEIPDVGSYPANPAGLYGMSEDTSEWVSDWFSDDYYKTSPRKNPTGPAEGTKKAMRGSVGGKAEIAAAVFMRHSGLPQPLRTSYPNGTFADPVMVPFDGYSSFRTDNFRCVVNSGKPVN
jgi:formylglycine-generating enzyme required for sulfatase activity